MERIALADAHWDFSGLVPRIVAEGITVEVDCGDRVVAQISPVGPQRGLRVQDLNRFLQNLPKLDDDATAFEEELRAVRRDFHKEGNAWD